MLQPEGMSTAAPWLVALQASSELVPSQVPFQNGEFSIPSCDEKPVMIADRYRPWVACQEVDRMEAPGARELQLGEREQSYQSVQRESTTPPQGQDPRRGREP